jgi:hypothetical protein
VDEKMLFRSGAWHVPGTGTSDILATGAHERHLGAVARF